MTTTALSAILKPSPDFLQGLSIKGRQLNRKYSVIAMLLFVLPVVVTTYLLRHPGAEGPPDVRSAMIFMMLQLASLSGLLIMRRIFSEFESLAGTVELVEQGERPGRCGACDTAEFNKITVTLDRIVDRLQHTSDGMEKQSAELKKEIDERRRVEAALREKEASISHITNYDSLTGLPNRMLFQDRLAHAVDESRRYGRPFALAILDLDDLNTFNNALGHPVGDYILRKIGGRLGDSFRKSDTVARIGGDEFAVLLAGVDKAEMALKAGRRILRAVSLPLCPTGSELHLTACMGISLYPHDGPEPSALMKNADSALNRAKGLGKNSIQIFSPEMNAAAMRRIQMENCLHKALDRGEFSLRYQPIVDLHSGETRSVETFIGWNSPELGVVSPESFIPIAEDIGLIDRIGRWVLQSACLQAVAWEKGGFRPVGIAVTLSPKGFLQGEAAQIIAATLDMTGLAPGRLCIGLTEGVFMSPTDRTASALNQLSALGVGISVDDFGTGQYSLSCLKAFPITTLKIDGSLVRGVASNPNDESIIRAITAMAHSLQLKVVAKGVETPHQMEALRNMGCDMVQGRQLSPPVEAAGIGGFLLPVQPR